MCFWSESKCMWQMGGFSKWRSVSKNKIKFKNQRILDFRSAIQNPRLILQNRFYFISNTFVVLSKPMLYTRLLFTYLMWMSRTYHVPLGQRTVIPWVKTQLSVIGHPFELFRNYGYAGSQFDSKKICVRTLHRECKMFSTKRFPRRPFLGLLWHFGQKSNNKL